MNQGGAGQLTPRMRRRSLSLALANAALWSAGNGLTTGSLVYYLAQQLGAHGLEISLLIAAPSLVGLLRMTTPAFIRGLGGVKPVCIVFFLAAYALLAGGLPAATFTPGIERSAVLWLLIGVVTAHQLLEFVAAAALWTWLGALAPRRVRGRFLARRNIWQLAALVPALVAGGLFADQWKEHHTDAAERVRLLGYVLPMLAGAVLLLASIAPLLPMCGVAVRQRPRRTKRMAEWLAPLRDRPFRRLLYYRGWFSFFNGVTQAAQNVFVYRVLEAPLLPLQSMQIGMRVGQLAVSPLVGVQADRQGNRPILIASQWLVAAALLFYAAATPDGWWLIGGAWALWIAYAGTNVCLYNLMLRLAPADDSAVHVSTFEALGGAAHGLSVVAGGWLLDRLVAANYELRFGGATLNAFAALFVFGWLSRTLGVAWLAAIPEPGAGSWLRFLRRRPR